MQSKNSVPVLLKQLENINSIKPPQKLAFGGFARQFFAKLEADDAANPCGSQGCCVPVAHA